MGHDLEHVLDHRVDVVVVLDLRFECQWTALNRGRDARIGDLGEDVGDADRVVGPLSRPPVGLVDLLLDDPPLERSVRKRVRGVDVQVVRVEERAQLRSRRGVGLELRHRCGGQTERDAERFVGGDAFLDARDVRGQARPQLVPAVGGMHECRVAQVTETVGELHLNDLIGGRA
jgi:hypothetical protein